MSKNTEAMPKLSQLTSEDFQCASINSNKRALGYCKHPPSIVAVIYRVGLKIVQLAL